MGKKLLATPSQMTYGTPQTRKERDEALQKLREAASTTPSKTPATKSVRPRVEKTFRAFANEDVEETDKDKDKDKDKDDPEVQVIGTSPLSKKPRTDPASATSELRGRNRVRDA